MPFTCEHILLRGLDIPSDDWVFPQEDNFTFDNTLIQAEVLLNRQARISQMLPKVNRGNVSFT